MIFFGSYFSLQLFVSAFGAFLSSSFVRLLIPRFLKIRSESAELLDFILLPFFGIHQCVLLPLLLLIFALSIEFVNSDLVHLPAFACISDQVLVSFLSLRYKLIELDIDSNFIVTVATHAGYCGPLS